MLLFDRSALRKNRERASRLIPLYDDLFNEVTARMIERLGEIRRVFPRMLELGARQGLLARCVKGRFGIEKIITSDPAPAMAYLSLPPSLAADESALPLSDHSFDLVASVLCLHWVEDLPLALREIRRVLKPDGLLLATLIGGESLAGLRRAFVETELKIKGVASPHVIPFATAGDLGALLQRSGFILPMVDVDQITIPYKDPWAFMHALRNMGEGNSLLGRSRHLNQREILLNVAEWLCQHYDSSGIIPAEFHIHYLTAWTPARRRKAD